MVETTPEKLMYPDWPMLASDQRMTGTELALIWRPGATTMLEFAFSNICPPAPVTAIDEIAEVAGISIWFP